MRVFLRVAVVFFLAATNLTCSVNILENFADKTTNKSLYTDAKLLINEGDYDGALEKLALITGSYASDHTVVALKASAYVGRCGLTFLPFMTAISSIGSTLLFPFLVAQFKSGLTTSKISDCITAEDLVQGISSRTDDENLLLILINFAKIGVELSYYADSDQDGTVLPADYDVCTLPDSDTAEVGWSVITAVNTISSISSSISLGSSSLTNISTLCGSLPPGYDFCNVSDKATLAADANMLKGIRTLINENASVGLGMNSGVGTCPGDVSSCVCP